MKKQKKQTAHAAPPRPATAPKSEPFPAYRLLEGPGLVGKRALQIADLSWPSWKPTVQIIGLGWAALAVCGLLWRLWTGSGTIVFLCFLLLGGGFSLAAIFDHFLRRGRRGGV